MLQTFHIASPKGAEPVQGEAWITTIGGREARLFIHTDCPLEGARLSCQRSGMLLGKIAPHLLAYAVGRGDLHMTPSAERDALGAALLVRYLVDAHGPEKLWRVMDAAPSLELEGAAA